MFLRHLSFLLVQDNQRLIFKKKRKKEEISRMFLDQQRILIRISFEDC